VHASARRTSPAIPCSWKQIPVRESQCGRTVRLAPP
jgi:hypothetical protein